MRLSFMNGLSLVSVHTERWSAHLGVKRDPTSIYKEKNGQLVTVDCDWIWGRATEPYDMCMEYFGLGPLLLVCWVY